MSNTIEYWHQIKDIKEVERLINFLDKIDKRLIKELNMNTSCTTIINMRVFLSIERHSIRLRRIITRY